MGHCKAQRGVRRNVEKLAGGIRLAVSAIIIIISMQDLAVGAAGVVVE